MRKHNSYLKIKFINDKLDRHIKSLMNKYEIPANLVSTPNITLLMLWKTSKLARDLIIFAKNYRKGILVTIGFLSTNLLVPLAAIFLSAKRVDLSNRDIMSMNALLKIIKLMIALWLAIFTLAVLNRSIGTTLKY